MTDLPEYVQKACKATIKNRTVIEQSSRCGCYYCTRTFTPDTIVEWTKDNSAICPHCGIDAVVPDASGLPIGGDQLAEMYDHWFGTHVQSRNSQKRPQ